ncbi:G3E family GTPase [Deinobacterium chartae]|uniref:G3E family GTPase n=1 Tax=Deinobacterium chartae TaxID=521158 RepID=A0A841I1Q5_9DEIO|nr:GTP-binding protein [Deinobacterium chartae]MBB6097875.1 G3E family GTPase [Deinobacterium chartae]
MFKFRQRIPVTVIGGFLGSGKTTLVNHLIYSGTHRYGVIVNEFGDLGIDGALIENLEEGGITELQGGCLCCVGREDLVQALVKLGLRDTPPEYVLIELSGLADPVPVLQTLLDPQVRTVFEIDGLVTVVDARNFFSTLQQNLESALQLAYASTVVINKVDLVDAELVAAVSDAVRQLSPLARVVTSHRSQVDPAALVGLRAFDPQWQPDDAHGHRHTEGVTSFVLEAHSPLDIMKWQWFLQQRILERPGDVLRVKGFLALEGIPERVLFQAVRDVFSAERQEQPHAGQSQLVVIGRGLDPAEYHAAFEDCARPVSEAGRGAKR